jgi:hypothetical protein
MGHLSKDQPAPIISLDPLFARGDFQLVARTPFARFSEDEL